VPPREVAVARKVRVPEVYKEARRKAEELGWTVEHGGEHIKWTPPDGSRPVYTQSSQVRSRRGVRNKLAALRSRGLPV
jgi:hypothetical protein